MGNPLLAIRALGQSIWLDNISRELLDTGKLARLIADDGISGVTSNPTIFEKAIGHSELYDRPLAAAAHDGLDARAIFFKVAYADIRDGADLLRPRFEETGGQDGHISFELPPEIARDAASSIEAAKRIYAEIDRPNVLIKVPATPEGVDAFRELTAAGISVNVTLLFAVSRYEEIANAYDRRPRATRSRGRAHRPARLGGELLRLARRHEGRRAPRGARPRRAAGHRRRRQRQAGLPLVRAHLLGTALGGARSQGRQRAAPAVGLDVHQEPRLSRHALRRHADRTAHRQHDAGRDDRGHARSWRRGAHDRREGRTRPRSTWPSSSASASTSTGSWCTSSSTKASSRSPKSFDSLIATIDEKARELAPARA